MRAHAEELEKSYFQLNGFISQDCHSWGLGFEIRSSKLYVSYTLGSYIPSTQTFLGPSDSRLCCIGGCEHLSGTANVDVWWGMGFLGGPAKMGILCSYKPFFQNDCYLCCAVKKLLLVKALVSLNLCKTCIYIHVEVHGTGQTRANEFSMYGYYLFGSRICRQHQHKHLYSMIVEILNFQIAIILKIHDTTG